MSLRLLCTAGALVAVSCAPGTTPAPSAAGVPGDYLYSFQSLPATYGTPERPLDDDRVALGKSLFFEPRLSASGQLSCNSCHDLANFGDDGRRVSIGHMGETGTRNAPSVYNAAGYIAQFWDGRSPDVEDQARHPILNSVEMAAESEHAVVDRLRSIPEYGELFRRAFPDSPEPITYDNLVVAIGAFERTLVTPARFDEYLRGDDSALSEIELTGFRRFVDVGCAGCHNGPELGGYTFEKLGHIIEYPAGQDVGRYAVTQRREDTMKFRVPGLRNVAETAPYFHDGSVSTLGEAVSLMARHQLGVQLSHADHRTIVAFLNALTGELPAHAVEPPVLPGADDDAKEAPR